MIESNPELYAWVGEDQFGSGVVGIKQARVPAGMIPIVATAADRHKIEREGVVEQFQAMANAYGKEIRLVRYVPAEEVLVVRPAEAIRK